MCREQTLLSAQLGRPSALFSEKLLSVLSLNPLLSVPVSVLCHESALPRTTRDTLGTVPVHPGPWQTLPVAYLLSRLQRKVGEVQTRTRQSRGLWPPTGCALSGPVSVYSGDGRTGEEELL